MTGTASQVEWAERIKALVNDEFDRVRDALQTVACRQTGQDLAETQAILAILAEKRAGVMANTRAGYFLRDWRELNDQVRQLLAGDARFREIQASRYTRRAGAASGAGLL